MRWEKKTKPLDGSERTITKFCWVPTWTGSEYVWWERVSIRQKCTIVEDPTSGHKYPSWDTLYEVEG